jgi:hypothetical protein
MSLNFAKQALIPPVWGVIAWSSGMYYSQISQIHAD